MSNINDVLENRGAQYGEFESHAYISQVLKVSIESHRLAHGIVLASDQKEALDMICHKIARIINGNPNYADSWIDIAGYATLVANRLTKESKQ
jgi:uncharacterized ferritin-like protein (DUF455 family)